MFASLGSFVGIRLVGALVVGDFDGVILRGIALDRFAVNRVTLYRMESVPHALARLPLMIRSLVSCRNISRRSSVPK